MSNKKAIQINIPSPCNEHWEKMTPCGQGRFCDVCQKTVIDFSTWSDRALYEFFSKNTVPVCGRFKSTQLEREIQIPHQPMSRLYRIAIACGLTLMFAQVPDVHAMVRQPIEVLQSDAEAFPGEENNGGSIKGVATDEKNEPVIGAIIEVYSGGIKKGGGPTDIDGNYEIKNLAPGTYQITGRYQSYKSVKTTGVIISDKVGATVNMNFAPNQLEEVNIISYKQGALPNDRGRLSNNFDMGDIQRAPTLDMTKLVATPSKLQTDDKKHTPDLVNKFEEVNDKKGIDISEERATRNVYKQGK